MGLLLRTRWGWTLFYDGEMVASADVAGDLWELALELEIPLTA